ncbi:MAG: hypothetical protein WA821_18070 [Anaerolineales bacterium]
MKKIHVLLTIAVLFSVVLSACGIAAPPPTPTAQPSDTPLPTLTPAPAPTDTPIPTDTPMLEPTLTQANAQPTGACVSTDKTYGYTQENPIKVGGDDFGGPPRERAYLDNLAGPHGEPISYNRTGSLDSGDTILDAYEISGLSKPVTLYIDEYSFTEPQAPVGFTCLGAFSLTAP